LVIVAPATADVIARFAAGLANDLLSAVVLATRASVLLAPAMNVNMWSNPFTQENLGRLVRSGRFETVGPDRGPLACGWIGEGRLVEAAEIAAAAERLLGSDDAGAGERSSLAGCRVVVTAGPTFEPIDDVRFLGNRSSGKMGFALAAEAARRGAAVTLIAGPVALPTPSGTIARVDVESASEMGAALGEAAATADVVVMAAAVADFRPATRTAGKLSRRHGEGPEWSLPLVANPDLLAGLGAARAAGGPQERRPYLVGFAAETGLSGDALVARASDKRREKGCDLVIANDVGGAGTGFGSDENAVTIVGDGWSETLPLMSKTELARQLWLRIVVRWRGVGAARAADEATTSAETSRQGVAHA
jgi:phosphopantothenoylcysteine decarboxylase/phosphopantothenate--cysteine ligase